MDFTVAKKNKGFTLIELVITIIVLGVLPATAVSVDVIQNNTTRTANYTDITVYEDNDFSRIGYGSGSLLSDLCYAQYYHTSATQEFTLEAHDC